MGTNVKHGFNRLFLVLASVWAAYCLVIYPQQRESYEELIKHFDYDRSAPLDIRETSVWEREGTKVYDLSYASSKGGRVPAYLVLPSGRGKFAGIVFGHWTMERSPTRNRTEFLEEAVTLTQAGVVSLLIDAPLNRLGYVQDKEPLSQRQNNYWLQEAIDVRRAVDLLLARDSVDARRLAYVGHSSGAN